VLLELESRGLSGGCINGAQATIPKNNPKELANFCKLLIWQLPYFLLSSPPKERPVFPSITDIRKVKIAEKEPEKVSNHSAGGTSKVSSERKAEVEEKIISFRLDGERGN